MDVSVSRLVSLPIGHTASLAQDSLESLAAQVVSEDRFAPAAASHEVASRAGTRDSQVVRHDGRVARTAVCFNIKCPLYAGAHGHGPVAKPGAGCRAPRAGRRLGPDGTHRQLRLAGAQDAGAARRGVEQLPPVGKMHFHTMLREEGLPEPPKVQWPRPSRRESDSATRDYSRR
jgi:hypothetical protein